MFGFFNQSHDVLRADIDDRTPIEECAASELHFISYPQSEIFLGIVEDQTTGERLKAFFGICSDCGGGGFVLKDLHK